MCNPKIRYLVPPKQWHLLTNLHGDTFHKTLIVIFMAINTSNFKRAFTWYTSITGGPTMLTKKEVLSEEQLFLHKMLEEVGSHQSVRSFKNL